jgi:branched-chain amino acid transport system substrate-binding protein
LTTIRKGGALACVALAAIALAACGNSKKDNSTGSPTAATHASVTASAAEAPNGKAIVIGSICSCSGVQASALGEVGVAVKAWAANANARGGVDGYAIKLIVKDDGGDPAKSLEAAKELVESDKVVAIVSDMSLADQAWADYVAGKGVPVIGGISTLAPMLTNADFFPSGTQLLVNNLGVALAAKGSGLKHLGLVYCAESPVCAQINTLGKTAAQIAGLQYSSADVSATAPSYTAPCLQLKSDGVDALYVADNTPTAVRFVDGCAQQGFNPRGAYNLAALSNQVLADHNFDGTVLAAPDVNAFDTSVPAVKEFQGALEKYAPGIVGTDQLSFPLLSAWAGGKLFEAAAEAAKLTPTSSSADLKRGLYALKNETLEGLAPPLNYTKGKPAFIPCWFTAQISGGKFLSESDKTTCLSNEQAQALASMG